MKLIRFTFLHFLILYGLVYSNQALGGTSDYNSLIVGKWKLTYSGKSSPVHTHVEFKADGTFSYTSTKEGRTDYEEHGKYKIEDETIYQQFSNESEWCSSKIWLLNPISLTFQEYDDEGTTLINKVYTYQKEDPNPPKDSNPLIYGKWEITGSNPFRATHVEFKADGTFSYTSSERPDYEEHGIFRIENNILYELFSNEKVWGLSKIVSIDSSSLILMELKDDGITEYRQISFEKVDKIDDVIVATVDGIKYQTTSSTECKVIQKEDYSGDIIIPENVSINGNNYTVTSIDKGAFIKKQNVQNVGCDITSVYIPNSVKTIGRDAFAYCKRLKDVKLPDDLIFLDTCTFAGCSSLVSITLPEKLQEIKLSAFRECGLKSIEIPKQVFRIGGFAFQGSKSLKTVITSSGLKEIFYYAFSVCDSINTIVLGENVEAIGCNAFEDDVQISAIYSLNQNPPSLNQKFDEGKPDLFLNNYWKQTFNWIFEPPTLYVPAGCKEVYSNSDWSFILKIIEFDTNTFNISEITGIRPIMSENKTDVIYSLSGKKQNTLSKGINIIKTKDGTTKKVLVK